MNTTSSDETILKTDALGRVQTPRERREQLLDEFEKRGLTGQKFAALVGVKYSTFATWLQKQRRQRGAYSMVKIPIQTADKVKCLGVVVEPAPSPGDNHPLVLECPGGAKVSIHEVQQAALVATLLRALAKPR